jgi:hypothetical protein
MGLLRWVCVPLAACLLVPSAAVAEPSFDVTVTPAVLRDSDTLVQYRLTITAGATPERFSLGLDWADETGPGLTIKSAGLAQTLTCARRRWHTPRAEQGGSFVSYDVDLAPGASTFLVHTLHPTPGPRWPTDDFGFSATASFAPTDGAPGWSRTITHPGPRLRTPVGVPITLSASARRTRIEVRGKAVGLPAGQRVRLLAYRPGATRARLVARAVTGRHGRFHAAFRVRRAGVWELYARYRSRLPRFADDASPCGVLVDVPRR